jgi:hypothetical protein
MENKIIKKEDFFAKVCSECNKGMNEGYCIGGGDSYYCDDICLHKNISKEEWKKLYSDEDSDSYWTEWDLDSVYEEYLEDVEEYTETHLEGMK